MGTPFSTDCQGYATSGNALAYYTFPDPESCLKTTSIYDYVQRPALTDTSRPRTVRGSRYTLQMAEEDFVISARNIQELAAERAAYGMDV